MLSIAKADLGTDEAEPKNVVILDRQTRLLYLASYAKGLKFVRECQEEYAALDSAPKETNTRIGMFEMLGGIFGGGYSQQQQQETLDLLEHLDRCVTQDFVTLLEAWAKENQGQGINLFSVYNSFERFYQRYRLTSEYYS